QAMTPMTPLQAGVEMFQRGKLQPFFAPRSHKARPVSEAVTEIFDTDFEDDSSEFEEASPKYSFDSSDSRRSQTTISTYDEVPTPHSSRRMHFDLRTREMKPVEGPKGPHLFRSSQSSADFAFDFALQLSPLVPKQTPPRSETAFRVYEVQAPYQDGSFADEDYFVQEELDVASDDVSLWTAQHVAAWMCRLGFEDSIIAKFEQHDITGAVLLDMQFEDLKELEIPSFGKRHQLWNHIDALRGNHGHISPAPTPFQDVSRPCTRMDRSNSVRDHFTPITPGGGRKRRGRKHRMPGDDIITPAESVSIVAIEQLLPKPHRCAKGERCNKWKKQQRQLQRLREEHGFPISPENGGQIFIAGDPGNAATAPNLVQSPFRPTSDAVPSVVASSDLLGPGQLPEFTLDEEKLRDIESRDPQENVKQFLTLQHVEPSQMFPTPVDRPSTPPLEMFPPLHPPLHPPEYTQPPNTNLRSLPKLSIPRSASANPCGNHAQPSYHIDDNDTFSPCRTAVASPGVYRFGTPASEMDVPVTAINLGPVSRDTSQSVPPSMQFRDPVERTTSRNGWRRPSFVLPALSEGQVFSPNSSEDSVTLHDNNSNASHVTGPSETKNHLLRRHQLQNSNPPSSQQQQKQQQQERYAGVNHAGWMKKRKTRLLRHEWHNQHFRLTGTRLAMHSTDLPSSTALSTIDVDEYAVACSSLASNKLSAKLKALKLSSKENDSTASTIDGAAAFSFQLVPVAGDGEGRGIVAKKVVGGKTHHFAVKTRDERIDWMRELMLAKALKAKGEGYEVQVNGNAI
ncbi:hypothetical protein K490DRAFT_34876, partial [Saccharata proteae CBS 121410]